MDSDGRHREPRRSHDGEECDTHAVNTTMIALKASVRTEISKRSGERGQDINATRFFLPNNALVDVQEQ